MQRISERTEKAEFDVTPSGGQPTLKLTERDLWRETSRFTHIAEAIAAHITHPSRAKPHLASRDQRQPDQRCRLFDPETRFLSISRQCASFAGFLSHDSAFYAPCESPLQPVSREAPLGGQEEALMANTMQNASARPRYVDSRCENVK